MKTVRLGVFETNSSSTHAICMCSDEDYQKFLDCELFMTYDRCDNYKLVTAEEIYEQFKKEFTVDELAGRYPTLDEFKEVLRSKGNFSYIENDDPDAYDSEEEFRSAKIEDWLANESYGNAHNYHRDEYETFTSKFNGVVAFGYYGYMC